MSHGYVLRFMLCAITFCLRFWTATNKLHKLYWSGFLSTQQISWTQNWVLNWSVLLLQVARPLCVWLRLCWPINILSSLCIKLPCFPLARDHCHKLLKKTFNAESHFSGGHSQIFDRLGTPLQITRFSNSQMSRCFCHDEDHCISPDCHSLFDSLFKMVLASRWFVQPGTIE